MKVIYTKKSVFKIFGIKVLDFYSDYYERSTDNDDNENDIENDWHENLIKRGLK